MVAAKLAAKYNKEEALVIINLPAECVRKKLYIARTDSSRANRATVA
jgi:hypothetical protein